MTLSHKKHSRVFFGVSNVNERDYLILFIAGDCNDFAIETLNDVIRERVVALAGPENISCSVDQFVKSSVHFTHTEIELP